MHPSLLSGPIVLSYFRLFWLTVHNEIISEMMYVHYFQSSSLFFIFMQKRPFQSQTWSCVKIFTSSTFLWGKRILDLTSLSTPSMPHSCSCSSQNPLLVLLQCAHGVPPPHVHSRLVSLKCTLPPTPTSPEPLSGWQTPIHLSWLKKHLQHKNKHIKIGIELRV